jgi:hypothetical protein
MGCFSDKFEEEIKEKSKRVKIELINELRHEIIQYIFKNPFYKVQVKDFRKFMKNFKSDNDNNLKITKDYILDNIIRIYFPPQNDINLFLFTSVVNFSFDRFAKVFREIDEDIMRIIFTIIFLFLTERQKGIKKEMKTDLCVLFEKLKLEVKMTKDDYLIKFNSGKFCFLLLNLIQLCSFCFLNFFCGPATLYRIANFSKDDLNIIFSDNDKLKIYEPDNINQVVKNSLSHINEIIQPNIINTKILTKVLQPLSEYIEKYKEQSVFWIESDKLERIYDILIDKMDYEYYIDLFFNIEEQNSENIENDLQQ